MVNLTSTKLKYFFLSGILILAGAMNYQALAQCPIANSCTPGNATNSQAALFAAGIYQVKLGSTFTNTSGGNTDGYQDYCSLGTTNITLGSPIAFSAKTGNTFTENVRVYIDINNDQVFTAATELFFSSNNAKTHSGNILVTSGTVGQMVKMRVTADLVTAALPGPCTTPEYSQVEDYAVKLVENVTPPIAAFSVSDSITCNGTVTFTDKSLNTPTTWLWDFGDGDTSTQKDPIHSYSVSGFYTVKLKVANQSGVDSLIKSNYIYYNDTLPLAASCQPSTINQCCGFGITRIIFNDLDNSSAVGTYQDFTCSQRTKVYQGRSYNLKLFTNPNQNQDSKAWIDYNNNGQFESSELVFSVNGAKDPSALVLISGDTAVKKNKLLRMRIMSEFSGGTLSPCTPLERGQTEDYTITILENNLPPIADFTASTDNFCLATYTFTSQSLNVINSYHWFFGDGSDSITTQPTVSHTYNSNGLFSPKLIVTGPNGIDSLTKLNSVAYYGAPANSCTLNTQGGGPQFTEGIAEVSFGTIKNRTGNAATDGYQNYSCFNQAIVKAGQKLWLTVRNSSTSLERVKAWIDWNSSGVFETNEQVMSTTADTVHSALITVPSSAVLNQTLRMRVASAFQGNNNFTSCGTIGFGQAEDYGVIVIQNVERPVTNFGAVNTVTCTGVIQFTDSTSNLPTSYHWSFGDGDTSNLAAPLHTYANAGSYTVSLITSNEFGSDTLIKPDYVTVTAITGLVPAACIPANSNNCCQYGIKRFSFAGIDNVTADGSEGNMDFTCGTIGKDTLGNVTPILIENSGTNLENVAVWIDWNNDGTFADVEKAFESLGNTIHQGVVTVPTTAPINVGIRVRVKSDFTNAAIGTSCGTPQFGQYEDYQIMLVGNNQSPVAWFGAPITTSCFNSIQLTDSSSNAPTSWKWYFGDGDSAVVRNPIHEFPGPGLYTVTLIVSNASGSDTIVRTDFVNIIEGMNLKTAPCTPSPVNLTNNPGVGITQVQFNTINAVSGTAPAELYVDRACQNRTTVLSGVNYTMTVRTSTTVNESCRAWVDWNNDGVFTDPAERVLNGVNARTHTAIVQIPTTAVRDTALRLRIISDFIQGPNGNIQPCAQPNFGQCEDYSIVVILNTLPPVAKISSVSRQSCNGFIAFRDSTQNAPTSWLWSFGDNTFSVLQNPTHQYTAAGLYTVKLKVTNSIGVDSVEIQNYVNITGLDGVKPIACTGTTSTPSPNHGTTRVRFGDMDKTSSFSSVDGGYVDYTCSDSATIIVTSASQNFPLIVNTSNPPTRENCRVYIDFNNSGVFENTEQVLGSNNNNTHTVAFVPTQVRCLGVPVRMRVITDNNFNNINNACYSPNQGQVEDYRVRLIWLVANRDNMIAAQVGLIPNPAADRCTLTYPESLCGSLVKVLDAQGKNVLQGTLPTGQTDFTLSTNQLRSGVYRILISGKEGTFAKPLVVQQ